MCYRKSSRGSADGKQICQLQRTLAENACSWSTHHGPRSGRFFLSVGLRNLLRQKTKIIYQKLKWEQTPFFIISTTWVRLTLGTLIDHPWGLWIAHIFKATSPKTCMKTIFFRYYHKSQDEFLFLYIFKFGCFSNYHMIPFYHLHFTQILTCYRLWHELCKNESTAMYILWPMGRNTVFHIGQNIRFMCIIY